MATYKIGHIFHFLHMSIACIFLMHVFVMDKMSKSLMPLFFFFFDSQNHEEGKKDR